MVSFEIIISVNGCRNDEFECNNTQCINITLRCNLAFDCPDGDYTDELNCDKIEVCPEGLYRCNNRQCISAGGVCDGTKQCSDGTDERNCANTTLYSAVSDSAIFGKSSSTLNQTVQLKSSTASLPIPLHALYIPQMSIVSSKYISIENYASTLIDIESSSHLLTSLGLESTLLFSNYTSTRITSTIQPSKTIPSALNTTQDIIKTLETSKVFVEFIHFSSSEALPTKTFAHESSVTRANSPALSSSSTTPHNNLDDRDIILPVAIVVGLALILLMAAIVASVYRKRRNSRKQRNLKLNKPNTEFQSNTHNNTYVTTL